MSSLCDRNSFITIRISLRPFARIDVLTGVPYRSLQPGDELRAHGVQRSENVQFTRILWHAADQVIEHSGIACSEPLDLVIYQSFVLLPSELRDCLGIQRINFFLCRLSSAALAVRVRAAHEAG
jgi:hypothetical protein